MDGSPHLHDDPPDRPETADARRLRLAQETVLIAEAEAEMAAGHGISLEAMRAWVESWDTAGELPPPEPGR